MECIFSAILTNRLLIVATCTHCEAVITDCT